jgi:hypothetical protein
MWEGEAVTREVNVHDDEARSLSVDFKFAIFLYGLFILKPSGITAGHFVGLPLDSSMIRLPALRYSLVQG